jgi:putative nucleotidyltransferase with HDIG domain
MDSLPSTEWLRLLDIALKTITVEAGAVWSGEPSALAIFLSGGLAGAAIGTLLSRCFAHLGRNISGTGPAALLLESGTHATSEPAPLGEADLRAAAAMFGTDQVAVLVKEPFRGSRARWGELHLLDGERYRVHRVPLQAAGTEDELGFEPPNWFVLPRPWRVKPLRGQAGDLGMLLVGSVTGDTSGGASEPQDVLIAVMAAWWSLRLDNCRLSAEAEARLLDIVESLITSVEARDPYTSGHSKRVCKYSELIALELGIAGRDLEEIAIGAALHDVGKLGIPEHILHKPSKLDDHEWQQMQAHPKVGARIIDSFNQSQAVLDMIYSHHEHFNGRGYPRGLAGEAIPLTARIVAVADAMDAMTSSRSYQRNRTVAEALEEVRRNAGTQFDPQIVQAVLRIPLAHLEAIAPTLPVAASPAAVLAPVVIAPQPVAV